ncbi:glycine cleavage system aminomethyltransferase GcvT [Leptolyngbyaceae cyanobacterium UHCC 1019]
MTDPHHTTALARTPLYSLAKQLNARMTEFSGWEMPVQYSGISHEHHAVRSTAGMFDISHMGKFRLTGKTVLQQLQTLVPSDLSRLKPGEAQYTVLLNDHAGIIDDLIFYYQGTESDGIEHWVAIVNAATTDKDKAWMLSHLDLTEMTFQDCSLDQALIAVQGPDAIAKLQTLVQEDLSPIQAFGHLDGTILGKPGFLARTGYTGEDGFEVMVSPEVGIDLWKALFTLGVVPCGLGCRDTLRLEAAMALYGQDIDDTTTPLEAGLGWLVHLDSKANFVGRPTLEHQKQHGVARRLVGLQMQGRNIARHDYPVMVNGKGIGIVTSGTQSPTLGQAIALAYVSPEFSKPGQPLEVEIRGKLHPAIVVKRPFYRRPPAAATL